MILNYLCYYFKIIWIAFWFFLFYLNHYKFCCVYFSIITYKLGYFYFRFFQRVSIETGLCLQVAKCLSKSLKYGHLRLRFSHIYICIVFFSPNSVSSISSFSIYLLIIIYLIFYHTQKYKFASLSPFLIYIICFFKSFFNIY